MTDSIVFLGTAGDSITVGKQIRASGGIVLTLDDNQFMLDPGPGCLVRARQADVNIRDTIAIIVSHGHTNHSNDLNAAIEALTVSGLDVMGVVVSTKKVINGDEKEPPVLSKRCAAFVERVIELEEGKKISINNVTIIPTKASHYDSGAIGFIFETQKYRVGYSSDTEFSDEIAEQYKNCDILILNVKNPEGVKEQGHMNSDDAIHFLRKVKPNKAIITHFGIKMLQADPLHEARRIQRETKVDIIAATDGLSLNPSSFATKMKQISLDEFKQ